MPPELLAFCGVAAVLVVTPGPDMALVAKNALRGGWPAVASSTAGICSGLVVHAVAAAAGVSALLQASSEAYTAVRIAGGAYLVAIGAIAIAHTLRRTDAAGDGEGLLGSMPAIAIGRRHGPYWEAFVSNVLNPKLIVFFITVLPQFASDGGSFFAQVLVLGLAFELLTAAWLLSYGAAVAKAGAVLRRPAVRRLLERLTGAILIALGLRVALQRD
jgi:threonine/homoserine/homoserine lactone efflux protein